MNESEDSELSQASWLPSLQELWKFKDFTWFFTATGKKIKSRLNELARISELEDSGAQP